MNRHRTTDRFASRAGVTLIELMFACGIVLVGLLGVAALIPLAGFEIDRGLTADRMSAAGRNAVANFDIRSMRRADMYVNPDGTPFDPTVQQLPLYPPNSGSLSFCIDPGYLHFHLGGPAPLPIGRSPRLFPSWGPQALSLIHGNVPAAKQPRMHRVAIRNHPGGTLISRVLADKLFVAQDDLAIFRPADPTLPPVQVYGSGTQYSRRQFNGNFSWLATLVPELNQPRSLYDQFILSIVVFDDRDARFDSGLGTNSRPEPIPERVLDIELLGGGFGGGEARLEGPTATSVDVRSGDWVMLAAQAIVFPSIPVAIARLKASPPLASGKITRSHFRWYRVLHSELDPRPVAGRWVRDITLEGPDWMRTEWLSVNLRQGDPDLRELYMPTQAIVIRDVVGVFEKTIRLENTSLWDAAP